MWFCATPATQNDGRCEFVRRLPHKVPRLPRKVPLLYVREGMWQWSYSMSEMVCDKVVCVCECVCVKLLYVKFVCEVIVCESCVCVSSYCMLSLCACVWSYCMWERVCDSEVIVEGSLEVKLPTIWRDEKQSRAEAQRRGRLEERRSEEKE